MNTALLLSYGFVEDAEAKDVAEQNAAALGLSSNGTYTVHHVFTKGDVLVTIEQNQAAEDMGNGMSAMVTHPPVAVATGPKGRCSFNLEDRDAAKAVLEWLAADG